MKEYGIEKNENNNQLEITKSLFITWLKDNQNGIIFYVVAGVVVTFIFIHNQIHDQPDYILSYMNLGVLLYLMTEFFIMKNSNNEHYNQYKNQIYYVTYACIPNEQYADIVSYHIYKKNKQQFLKLFMKYVGLLTLYSIFIMNLLQTYGSIIMNVLFIIYMFAKVVFILNAMGLKRKKEESKVKEKTPELAPSISS